MKTKKYHKVIYKKQLPVASSNSRGIYHYSSKWSEPLTLEVEGMANVEEARLKVSRQLEDNGVIAVIIDVIEIIVEIKGILDYIKQFVSWIKKI